jgi:lysophospholipase L1-like esterase
VNPPPKGAIVITGSSSIRRWHNSIVKDLAPLTIIPRGFGGSTMKDALHFIDRLAIKYMPRAVIVYEGDNDTGRYLVPPSTIVDTALPETRVYILSVKPSVLRRPFWDKARETNELLKKLVAGNDLITYIDVAGPLLDANGKVMTDIFVDDNLHLNEKGTRIWAATIKAALMKGEAQFESAVSKD